MPAAPVQAQESTAPRAPTDPETILNQSFPWPRIDGIRSYGIGQPSAIDVDPDLLHFDDTTRTATVTFRNPATTVDTIWLAPECGGDGKAQPDDPLAATWQNRYACAAPWVSGYPQYLVLAPQERRTLRLHLHPYPTLPDGRYIARLMINGISQQSGHDETAIEYIKGPKRPHRVRARWVATGPTVPVGATVHVDRSVLVLDDTTRSETVTLINPGATATELWLTMDCPWFRVHYDTVSGYTHKSQYEFTWHLIEPNMVTWLSGYPRHMVLAPHEQRAITIHLVPFYNSGYIKSTQYPVGSYYAQLRYIQPPMLRVTSAGDTTFTTPVGVIDVVYQKGTGNGAPRLALGPLQYTRHSDGTATACVMVQQPGLGLVATVHAVTKNTSTGTSSWNLDTTVVVWEIVHHHDLKRNDIGRPVSPDPVCIALPDFAPGRYQLTVSVHALGGNSAQATTPLEVP